MTGAKLYVSVGLIIGGVLVGSCTPPRSQTPARKVVLPPPPSQPRWPSGLQVKIALMDFVNETGLDVKTKAKKKTPIYDPFGSSIRERIGRTLTQVGAFTVIEQLGQNKAGSLQQGKESRNGEVASASQERPKLILSGILINYTPSQTSLDAGLSADPLLGGAKDKIAAEKLFKTLSERVIGGPDRVAFEVELTESTKNARSDQMSFDCIPPDWAVLPTDLFGERLRTSFPPPHTPMQEALQACIAKITNWIGERYLAWRENPSPPEEIPFDPRLKKIQQGLNKLGYACGKEDGQRGAQTKECMTKFLSAKGIQEADLEKALEKELTALKKGRPRGGKNEKPNNKPEPVAQPSAQKPPPPTNPPIPDKEENEWDIQ